MALAQPSTFNSFNLLSSTNSTNSALYMRPTLYIKPRVTSRTRLAILPNARDKAKKHTYRMLDLYASWAGANFGRCMGRFKRDAEELASCQADPDQKPIRALCEPARLSSVHTQCRRNGISYDRTPPRSKIQHKNNYQTSRN